MIPVSPSLASPAAPSSPSGATGGVRVPGAPSTGLKRAENGRALPVRSCTDCTRLRFGDTDTPTEGYVACPKDMLGVLPADGIEVQGHRPALLEDGDTTWIRLGRAILDAPCFAFDERPFADSIGGGDLGEDWKEYRREKKAGERANRLATAAEVPCPECRKPMKTITADGRTRTFCSGRCARAAQDAAAERVPCPACDLPMLKFVRRHGTAHTLRVGCSPRCIRQILGLGGSPNNVREFPGGGIPVATHVPESTPEPVPAGVCLDCRNPIPGYTPATRFRRCGFCQTARRKDRAQQWINATRKGETPPSFREHYGRPPRPEREPSDHPKALRAKASRDNLVARSGLVPCPFCGSDMPRLNALGKLRVKCEPCRLAAVGNRSRAAAKSRRSA